MTDKQFDDLMDVLGSIRTALNEIRYNTLSAEEKFLREMAEWKKKEEAGATS